MSTSYNTVTICSTARLVRGVLTQYQQRQQAAGVQQWQAFEAYTLQQWLEHLIGDASLLGLLDNEALPVITLSPVAEAYLWEQAIASCLEKHEAAALFDIRALAQSAIEANQLMCDWQISESAINHHFISQESRQYLRWRHTFQSLCAQKNAIEPARLKLLQIELAEKHVLSLPSSMILAGFDRITPLEQRLFDCLKAKGVKLELQAANLTQQAQARYFSCNDSHAECRAAVAWAKQKLTENPNAQLAIISPALSNIRRELADLLDDTFHPETLKSMYFEKPRCYDFSLGLALTEYAIVHSALQLLRLASSKADLSFDALTPVLLDIYWGEVTEFDAELNARAQFDAHLRQHLSASYRFEVLLSQAKMLNETGRLPLAALIDSLEKIAQFQQQSHTRQLPSVWVNAFVDFLASLHWAAGQHCSNKSLSSHEYQTQQAFFKCLKELGGLDSILGKTTLSDVVQKLIELCSVTMFQPESKGKTHIQLLGLLETPAVQLDAVWAMNMNDLHWPPPVKLNPLLPAELQRSQGTPNASTGIQNTFATLVQHRLMLSAPEIVFSYALKEDERELRPSPLLVIDAADSLATMPILLSTLAERLAQPVKLEMLDDSLAPVVLAGEKVRGGVKLFATQAVCPAWAFYQYRLGANKLETPVDGLDNMVRGSLLHKVLQYFWQDCGNLTNLQAMDQAQRLTAINSAIDKSVQALHDQIGSTLSPQVLMIERQRLTSLLQFWLEVESARADFEVVDCEQAHVLDIEGLSIKLTIDRIDRLPDGSVVVIDYKTSSTVANKSWADDRIAEPQLPMYAVLALKYEQISAVCFAKIRTDEAKFIGLSVDDGVLPAVSALAKVSTSSVFQRFDDWDSLLEHWYLSLTGIAQEIKSGVASVTFSNETDLAYCDVKPLLRLPERTLQFERLQSGLADDLERHITS
jgi:exodeoxyribonuclease-5